MWSLYLLSLLKFVNLNCFAAGSLIKLVYFSRHEDRPVNDSIKKTIKERLGISNGNRRSYPVLGGRLHFVKFETNKINQCLDFISSKQLHCGGTFFPCSICKFLICNDGVNSYRYLDVYASVFHPLITKDLGYFFLHISSHPVFEMDRYGCSPLAFGSLK